MLNENIKALRKSKGISQEELAIRLNVVRQTISKWEKGLSVPDSQMLLCISEQLEAPVCILLGETIAEARVDDLKVISEKLEVINLQFSKRNSTRRKLVHLLFIIASVVIVAVFILLGVLRSPYLDWDYSHPEYAVIGVLFHSFEWLFVRLAPFALIGSVIGIVLSRKKMQAIKNHF